MRVTVVICTWNRCSLLERALERLTRLSVPDPVEWELLVVDNNSSDATPHVLRRFERLLPLRSLEQPRAGKSHALNLAVGQAQGDYILFTDDDVLVDEGWLEAYVAAFRRWPGCGLFGGPIEPLFEGEPPPWLRRTWVRVRGAYGVLPADEGRVELGEGPGPFGANMAVRSDEQRRFPYDPAYGPQPGSPVRGEETAVAQAMLAAGIEGRWVPGARVHHVIPSERQTAEYLRSVWFGLGLFDGLHADFNRHPRLFGRPRWLWRQLVEGELRYRVGRIVGVPEVWVAGLVRASGARGTLQGIAQRPKLSNTEEER